MQGETAAFTAAIAPGVQYRIAECRRHIHVLSIGYIHLILFTTADRSTMSKTSKIDTRKILQAYFYKIGSYWFSARAHAVSSSKMSVNHRSIISAVFKWSLIPHVYSIFTIGHLYSIEYTLKLKTINPRDIAVHTRSIGHIRSIISYTIFISIRFFTALFNVMRKETKRNKNTNLNAVPHCL